MSIPSELIVFETAHWVCNHRMDTCYPGYLIIESRAGEAELAKLRPDSLRDLGRVLALAESTILRHLKPVRVMMSKLGFTPGYSAHFHMIPVYSWALDELNADPRYAVTDADGLDLSLFVSREYCEGDRPLPEDSPNIVELVEALRCLAKTLFGEDGG